MSPSDFLSAAGPLAGILPGFAARAQQQAMAEAVAEALADNGTFVCEAGTGTGKTFAYLVPALLSGKRVLISTGTKPLQDQLFNRDLPLVRKALGKPVSAALLKGRNNYLCPHRLEQNSQDSSLFPSRDTLAQMALVREWARRTRDGDIAELDSLPEDAEVWPQVTSTADNCLGNLCPQLQQCFLLKARRQANQADILVINHHLLFADMALRDQGFGELLPAVHAVILDEAHQLAETAANFFGLALSSRQCNEFAKDSVRAEKTEAGDYPQIASCADELEHAVRALRQAFDGLPQRGAWPLLARQVPFAPALARLASALDSLSNALGTIAERGKDLENCWRRGLSLRERLHQIAQADPSEQVQWFETSPRGFMLRLTPLSIAERFQAYCGNRPIAWIFTSATLSVGENFSHFCGQLGLDGARTRRFQSPFDFANAALLYVPPYLPEPREPDYTQAVVKAALPVLRASRGRAFLLFTSHRALQEAAGLLQEAALPYPLLIQGNLPRGQLLQRFRQLGDAILLGTGSFWEGVDVRGEALSCVIIDKLPFASPGDPVMEARIKHSRDLGGNPFNEFQLPQAVISLKQGVGRLIRDVTDRGVLVICDPRLYQKSYGRTFLQSLPPLPKTRQLAEVEQFFADN